MPKEFAPLSPSGLGQGYSFKSLQLSGWLLFWFCLRSYPVRFFICTFIAMPLSHFLLCSRSYCVRVSWTMFVVTLETYRFISTGPNYEKKLAEWLSSIRLKLASLCSEIHWSLRRVNGHFESIKDCFRVWSTRLAIWNIHKLKACR